ncbi:hypothetical protein B0H19DRAFT_1071170 [Mycena capillaripes]|nr:hypothetical protein B0H19DRAFT_1071170 [Mycena capillaripes]
MPPKPTDAQTRLNSITACMVVTENTVETLAIALRAPFLEAIANTTRSLLKNIQTVKQNKETCAELMEETHYVLNGIIGIYIESDSGGELAPSVLNHIGKFNETLQKIHTFVEAQQNGSKIKKLFRQSEISALLKDCKAGLQQEFDFFLIRTTNLMPAIMELQEDVHKRHQEILNMIESLSESCNSDRASVVCHSSKSAGN